MRAITSVLVGLVFFASLFQITASNDSEMKHLIYKSEVSSLIHDEVVKEMNEVFLSPLQKSFTDIDITSDKIGYSVKLQPKLYYTTGESYLDPYVTMYQIKTFEPTRTFWELPTGLDNSKVYDTVTGVVGANCIVYRFRYIPTKYNYIPSQAISKTSVKTGDVVKSSPNEIVFLTDGKTFSIPVLPTVANSNPSMGYYETPLVSTSVNKKNIGNSVMYEIKIKAHNMKELEIKFEDGNTIPTVDGKQVPINYRTVYNTVSTNKLMVTNEVVIVSEFLPAIRIKHNLVDFIEWNTDNINFPLKSIRWDI